MIAIPIVAYTAFCNDFPNLNKWEHQYYYIQQVAMKYCFGYKSTIKFIS